MKTLRILIGCALLVFLGSRALAQVYTFPVVVHVIHQGESYGKGMHIPEEKVRALIRFMNNAYRRQPGTPGYGIPGYGTDAQIQFCLASKDENGNPTSGIHYVDGSQIPGYNTYGWLGDTAPDGTPYNTNEVILSSKWNPTSYVNIVLITRKYGEFENVGGVSFSLGVANMIFAAFPYQAPQLETEAFRTVNHEMGHFLGLYHTFESYFGGEDANGCPVNNDCANEGDLVCDTPPHKGTDAPPTTCSNTGNPGFDTSYANNIMSYNRALGFTQGQVDRMRATIAGSTLLSGLVSAANQTATGLAPVWPNVTYTGNTCGGAPVSFKYIGGGSPDLVSWTFEGGEPATSTDLNPVVYFATPGSHKVGCTFMNILGPASGAIKFVNVSSFSGVNMPVVHNFGNYGTNFPGPGWNVTGTDLPDNSAWNVSGKKKWQYRLSDASMNMYSYPNHGQRDQLVSAPISLRGAVNPKMVLKRAYKNYPAANRSDTLRIMIQKNCSATYDTVFVRGGAALATNGSSTTAFAPSVPADWKEETIDLRKYAGNVINIIFETINHNGNNLYLNDFNIYAYPTIKIAAASKPFSECSGFNTSFTALTEDEGPTPSYIWTVNGASQSNNTPALTGNFAPGAQIQCKVQSSLPAAIYGYTSSNTITIGNTTTGLGLTDVPISNNTITLSPGGPSLAHPAPGGPAYWKVNDEFVINPVTGLPYYGASWFLNTYHTGDLIQIMRPVSGSSCPQVSPVYTLVNQNPGMRQAAPGQPEAPEDNSLLLYPNPAKDAVTVTWDLGDQQVLDGVRISVRNMMGQEALPVTAVNSMKTGSATLDVSALPPGYYLVRLQAGNRSLVRRLALQR